MTFINNNHSVILYKRLDFTIFKARLHKSHINKCIDVVKKLLKQKSNIEKKEARQKCMQNRLRLGQFVTQRVGATFQENWTDGYAFQELAK